MLQKCFLLYTTLRRMLYERGKIDLGQVDVRFDRPTRQWADALTAPTLNLFLIDLARFGYKGNQRHNGMIHALGIYEIALNAAFLAADTGEPVRMAHLLHAARVE